MRDRKAIFKDSRDFGIAYTVDYFNVNVLSRRQGLADGQTTVLPILHPFRATLRHLFSDFDADLCLISIPHYSDIFAISFNCSSRNSAVFLSKILSICSPVGNDSS